MQLEFKKMLLITLLILINISNLVNVNCQTVISKWVGKGSTSLINGRIEANESGRKSLKWRFETDLGNVLSFRIVEDHFQLSNSDCVVNNVVNESGPIVEVTLYPIDSKYRNVFFGCTNHPIQPRISSNIIEVLYKNIQPNGDFIFEITAKFSGYIMPNVIKDGFNVPSRKFPQWIALRKDRESDSHIFITLKSLKVKESKKAVNCKSSFLNVHDDMKNPLLNVCNHDESYGKEQTILTEAKYVNITFRKASFHISARSLNHTDPTILPTTRFTLVQEESRTTQQMSTPAEGNSGIYLIIGLVLAAVLVFISVIFAIRKVQKRRQAYDGRRESNKPLESEMNTYTSGTTLSLPYSQPQSINNVMYERILNGSQNTVAVQQTVRGNTPLNSIDKRSQRLSQLEEKYIDIEINSHPNAPKGKKTMVYGKPQSCSPPRKPSHLDPAEVAEASSSFHHVRPPIPLPCSSSKSNDYARTYESFNPQLTESDLASPAYATINDAVQEPHGRRKFAFPSNKGIPVGEYTTSGEIQQITKRLPKATYISSESLIDSADSSQSWQKPSPQARVTTSGTELPVVGKGGYLSLTYNENSQLSHQAPDAESVNKNSFLKESLQCQGHNLHTDCKLENISSSMPNLLSEKTVDVAEVYSTPLKVVPQTNTPDKVTHGRPAHFSQQPPNGKSPALKSPQNRYKHPRPSVPDIFLQCAYTTGDDVTQIQNRLQKLAAEAHKNNSPSDSSPPESPTCGDRFLYDSPRPSICTTSDCLQADSSKDFYDTPRPSLPNIYPGEFMKPFLNGTNMNEQW